MSSASRVGPLQPASAMTCPSWASISRRGEGGAVPMHVRHSVGDRENRLPHGPLRGGLAAPEHALEPVILEPTRTLRRATTGGEGSGPEAEGELTIVAVGPYTHEIIGHHEADFEIPRHVGQPGCDFCGDPGSLLARKDRMDVLPESLHAIEVGRLAARNAV